MISNATRRNIAGALIAVMGGLLLLGLIARVLMVPSQAVLSEAEATTGLQIRKTGPLSALAGDTITYTIYVTNATGSILNNVIITDTWNGQVYSGTYEYGGAVAVDSLVLVTTPVKYAQFNLAPLGPNSNGAITLTMLISPQLEPRLQSPVVGPTVLGNSVVITTSTPGVSANTDRVDTAIVGPLLQLTKSYTPTNPRIGRLLTYTFKLENKFRSDAIDATNVVITERLPVNTQFYAAYPPSIAAYYPATNTVQWKLTQTIPVSSAAYVTLTVRITPTAPYGNIGNPRTFCATYADGLPLSILCSTDVNTLDNDIFEKVGQTVSPPQQSGAISRTFPNRIMTYTVSVYNPFSYTVSGMIVTDTLPTNNNRTESTFQFLSLLSSSPPALPTVIPQNAQRVGFQLPAIAGWGLYTFTFRVLVPPQMHINDNTTEQQYQNSVSGNYAGIVLTTNDGGHDDSMKVRVVAQILTPKSVTPSAQLYGELVTYTLVVSNSGPTTIHNIQLTDTLPGSFQWDSLVSGQPPIFASGNLILWSGITLTGYAQTTLAVFRVQVFGLPGQTYRNTIYGFSPDTYIVKRTDFAPVLVLAPFGYTKNVNPTSVVLGSSIQYHVTEFNLSRVIATMSSFTDVLPSGFYYNGSRVFAEYPNLVLQPNHANEYQATFNVNVISTSVACDSLPATVYQAPGRLLLGISAPPDLAGIWTNGTNVAGVLVRPQAQVYKTANPPAALPGDVVTFTITLSNNTNSLINSVRLTDTLPGGFVYGGVLPGTPPQFAIQGNNVFWNGLSIPANGTSTLVFKVTAPITPTINPINYTNQVKAASLTDPAICIPKTTTPIPVKNGVRVNKTVTPNSVGPLGQFVYNISLNNTGPYTVTIGRFTETLPGVPGYIWKFISMQSSDPLPVSTNPLVWTNLTIGAGKAQNLRFTVRTDTQVGTYPNLMYQAPLAGFMTGTLSARWIITPVDNYYKYPAPVTVVPGVGIAKDVYPDTVLAGQTVVYTITVVNVSGSTVTNVRVTDTLPSGFTFDGYLAGEIPLLTNPPVWDISSIANGSDARKTMVFRARVSSLQPSGTYFNHVAANASNASIAPTGDTAPVVVMGIPTLNLSKAVDPAVTISGREVTYTLTLVNPDTASPVTARLTDTLPGGFSFATMISGPMPILTTPRVVWNNVVVPANSTAVFIFRAHVAANTPNGTYYNQLDGSSPQLVFQSTGPTAPVYVVAAPTYDVQVSKTDRSHTAAIGSRVVYTIDYTNTQNLLSLTAGHVVITDTFSPSAYLVADAPGWNLVAPGKYTYSVGDLAANTTGFVTIGLHISNAIPIAYYTITNTAEIGSDGAPGVPEAIEQPTSNNISTDIDTIRGSDLTIVNVSSLPSSVRQNSPITVVVKVQNLGVDVALGPDNQGWFGTDLYVKPGGAPPPINPGDRYLGACPTITNYCPNTLRPNQYFVYAGPNLAPGNLATLTYTYRLTDSGVHRLYVQADTFWGQNGDPDPTTYGSSVHGRVFEGNEQNNIYGPIEIYVVPSVYLPLIRK